MHDVLTIGIPLVAIFFGILLSQKGPTASMGEWTSWNRASTPASMRWMGG
jgi:hypothetical protein